MAQIEVVLPARDEIYIQSEDILRDGDDLAMLSDSELIERIAAHLDMADSAFAGMIVTRPTTGNILIAPRPVYGNC